MVLSTVLGLAVLGAAPVLGTQMASAAPPTQPELPSASFRASAVHHDVSAPLRSLMAPTSPTARQLTERPLRLVPNKSAHGPDGALQSSTTGAPVAATPGVGFAGVGQGDYGFSDRYAPPDVTAAVGTTQYIQWVNTAFAVFDKSGNRLAGPSNGNSIWSGFGGGCQTNNDGDPIVVFDKLANRWVMTQFSVSTTPYLQCVAVSRTADALGSWNRYSFSYGSTKFNDYPKLGVWSDGYYITYNIFNNGRTWGGALTCAFDRTQMLVGAAATQQCFQSSTSYGGLLPADLDGTTPPPAGSPNYVMSYGNNSLNLWKFHVDWATPANSTFGLGSVPGSSTTVGTAGTPDSQLSVAPFSAACQGGGACIPQLGTSQALDSLADRLMYRLAYRKLADGTESMVVNHSVSANGGVGLRWYELHKTTGDWSVYQQSTFAPDSNYRWMGSVAQDAQGNLALGYSQSSSAMYPGIYYTGRLVTDELNTLQTETLLKAGGGSQLSNLTRWGDYSSMTVDPVDDCTFWYSTEYLKASGTFNWSTWISSFKFAGCTSSGGGGGSQILSSISVTPAAPVLYVGQTQQFSAVALDQTGSPMASQPTFTWSDSGVGSIDSSTGLYSAGGTTGSSVVTAATGGVTGQATVTVQAVPALALSANPTSLSVTRGGTARTSTITVTRTNDTASASFTALNLPAGLKVSFSPKSTTGNTSTMSVSATRSAVVGSYTITIRVSTTSPAVTQNLSFVVNVSG